MQLYINVMSLSSLDKMYNRYKQMIKPWDFDKF